MIKKEVIGKFNNEKIVEKNTSRHNETKEKVVKVGEDENKVVYRFVDDDKKIDLRQSQK